MRTKRFITLLLSICLLVTMCFSNGSVMAEDATPTITVNQTAIYKGQSLRFDFTNIGSGLTFGILPGRSDGHIAKWEVVAGYKPLSAGAASYSCSAPTTAGYYVAAVWGSGWDFKYELPIYVNETPEIYLPSTKIELGSTVTVTINNVKAGATFGAVKCSSPGNVDWSAGQPQFIGYSPIVADATSVTKTVTFNQEGDWAISLWGNGWSWIAQLPVTVAQGLKTASLDKTTCFESDKLTLSTANWSEEDGDFFAIYDSSVTDITADTQAVYSAKDNAGKVSYTIDTTGWEAGTYRLVAFDSGDYTADYITDTTFTVKLNKKVTMDKTSYTTDDEIIVTTNNWTTGEFIRIYKTPVSGYNSNVLADTHSTVWGKSEYRFYPYEWEAGEYELCAFDAGGGWPVINKIKFTVTEPEAGPYTVDGDTLTVNEDIALELSEVTPTEYDGKLFIGWHDAEGVAIENNQTLTAGTVLYAQYIDYNADSVDFGVVETSVRTEVSTAVRFTVQQSAALYSALPTAAEYGVAVLPSIILDDNSWAELQLDRTYIYGGKEYTAAAVSADRIYETLDDGVRYTACITDISADKYTRQYTARGYIRYTDLNGVERVLYTDYASANLFAAARSDAKKDGVAVKKLAVLNGIIDTVKTAQTAKYNVEKITVAGDPSNTDTYVYQLGEDGIYVRDAIINVGLDKPIEIVQLSDTHFNYINAKDIAAKNPTVMGSAFMRDLARNAASVRQARNVVDFARTADGVVVTGDIFDYLSWGGVELMYKEIWDVIPDAMMAVGNHEYEQKMLGTMPENKTLAQRWSVVESVWKHDVYYSSKVIDDKVMLIQMNNGEAKFYDRQIAPLTADIELARQKGYTVLVFMHEPICTGNSAESAVAPIRTDDAAGSVANFYTKQVGGSGADTATLSVVNLIKSNADVIKGVFNGHMHNDYYTEISATTNSGAAAVIPQYTLTGGFYNNGSAIKITVK